MNKDKGEIQRKLRILRYADEIGHVAKACRYFGIGRASFYRWRKANSERGEAGLVNAPPIPKWHANRTSPEYEEKVIYLRRKYHLGPMRIVWGAVPVIEPFARYDPDDPFALGYHPHQKQRLSLWANGREPVWQV